MREAEAAGEDAGAPEGARTQSPHLLADDQAPGPAGGLPRAEALQVRAHRRDRHGHGATGQHRQVQW